MRKLIERLMIFFIGIPAIFALVFFLPYFNHLALNVVIVIFSSVGAYELSVMLKKKGVNIPAIEAFILGALAPLSAVLTVNFGKPDYLPVFMLMAGFFWSLLSMTFSKKENLGDAVNRFLGCVSVIIYPGVFMYWLSQTGKWESSSAIFIFLLIVFFNDSFAWLFGSLFGKNNKGIIPASPNKSIAGFIGGILGSVLVSIPAFFYLLINSGFSNTQKLIIGIIIGFFTGIFATLGDLAESAIKRSCDCKDSGNIMLGRGGILDSIDSIAAAAPVYFLLYTALSLI